MGNTPNIIEPFSKRLNTTAGLAISILTLVAMGFGAGKYYSDVVYKGEINELKNEHALEIIEIKKQQSLEMIEVHKRINLLEIDNEKRKK